MKKLLAIFFIIIPLITTGQEMVFITSSDGLKITADFYQSDPFQPYMIFMHQARSSRGEYKEIAPRFVKMGYNFQEKEKNNSQESPSLLCSAYKSNSGPAGTMPQGLMCLWLR